MTPMMSSLSESNLWMSPIFRIWLNIENGGTWRISFESPRRDESDDVITSPPSNLRMSTIFSYLIKYSKWRHATYTIRKPLPSWVRWRHHFPHRTSGGRRFFVSVQIFKMAGRDAYNSKALRRARVRWRHHFPHRTSGCSRFFVFWLNIQNGGTSTHIIRKALPSWSPMTSSLSTSKLRMLPIFSYLIKYSKWRHVTHIIRKPLPSWVRWRHHFPHRTSGCSRFFVSD